MIDAAPVAQNRSKAPQNPRVKQTNFNQPIVAEPDPEHQTFVRPFRKMSEILPYDSYEPDRDVAAKDKCFNQCPRPRGGECPDCAALDADGRPREGAGCPDCPWEQDLRRIGRGPGESNIPYVPRNFAHIDYSWEPTNMYHNPIYFEDVPLERYGHTRHYLIQPVFSGVKFATQLLGLPYQMTIHPCCSRQYSLGYYRPGEYVPYKYYQIPLNVQAAIVEAGVIAGGYFIVAPGVGP